jgi:N6-L-threonylcarbamoyladenine synthase/tRNA threonylcarbamoyladenosine biosynthesis protein TsaB
MSKKIILSLDSSMIKGSVAIAADRDILCEVFITRQKSFSEQMNFAIDEVLRKSNLNFSDLNAIAVINGPGSFTGLRVAGNIAKTLSYIFKIPLLSLNTLEVLARQVLRTSSNLKPICPMINAYKQMVFLALYNQNEQGKLVENLKPGLFSIDQLDLIVTKNVYCVGDAFDYYKEEFNEQLIERLSRDKRLDDYPLPEAIISLAIEKLNLNQTIVWNEFTPLYLKPSEAEENLRKGLLHFRRFI